MKIPGRRKEPRLGNEVGVSVVKSWKFKREGETGDEGSSITRETEIKEFPFFLRFSVSLRVG